MTIPTWKEYFMGFAKLAATKSKDSTQVGAVLVGPDFEIRLTGYNGPPKGVLDAPARRERPTKYLYASHAEANIIAFAARQGIRTEGCTIYCTHHPCAACARTLIQAGVVAVVYGSGTFQALDAEREAVQNMAREAGIRYEAFSE